MTTNRSMIAKALIPGVHQFVGLAYGETPQEHLPLFEVLKSGRSFEEEVHVSGMGGASVKHEGQAVMYDDIRETFTSRYQHETIAAAFAVTKEAFDDDQYSIIARAKSQELGRAMADTKQVKAASIFNYGFDTSGLHNGGDGVPLFGVHPTTVGSYNNMVQADLSESALEDAVIAISKMTNDRGILMSAKAQSLHIPAELQFVAQKILKSDLSTGIGLLGNSNKTTNDTNAIREMGILPKGVHINHRFTDPDAWFIKTSVTNGTKMFIREALAGSNDTDFNTDNMLFKFRERYSFGWTDARQWYGSSGN